VLAPRRLRKADEREPTHILRRTSFTRVLPVGVDAVKAIVVDGGVERIDEVGPGGVGRDEARERAAA